MFGREIPVYLFTGLLESGKTTFIQDTLGEEYFNTGEKTLLILCEEGMEEYDEIEMRDKNVFIELVEEEQQLTEDFFKKCQSTYKPKRILIEYNGMWKLEKVLEDQYPQNWVLTQVISFVDASTFNMYWGNMRSIMIDQLSMSDMIILNRCDENTKRNDFRRAMKLFNKKAQIGYDFIEGFDGSAMEEQLPFDLEADVIEIDDDDYGIFYMDIMENTNKYAEKTVKFHGIFFRPDGYGQNVFVPGRFAMTCCADDISYMGILCKSEENVSFRERDWLEITAKIQCEYVKEYQDMGPVLYLKEVKAAQKPEDELVYF